MSKSNNFISGFQRDHSQLLKLISSFGKAIETSNFKGAKNILDEIDTITNGHFNFEETYFYPRLRRLILEITNNLGCKQERARDFINKSRNLLKKNKLSKNEIAAILEIVPQLCIFFQDCNDLVSLAEKFNKEDREDLDRRFKECCETKAYV